MVTLKLWDGVTLVRCGGHFPRGTVMHWAGGAGGRGIICAGDILTVATDRKWLSFMRSYPNFIPLSAREVEHIGEALAPFKFDIIYGHYFDRVIAKDAKQVLGEVCCALRGRDQRHERILRDTSKNKTGRASAGWGSGSLRGRAECAQNGAQHHSHKSSLLFVDWMALDATQRSRLSTSRVNGNLIY